MRRDERGQSLVETALILPVFLLLLVGILDFGRIMYSYAHLHMAAQETVRMGGLGKNDTEITSFAKDYVQLQEVDQLKINISPGDSSRDAGDYVTVKLEYPFQFFTPFVSSLFSSSLSIKTESTIRVE
ncbi:pilus assembly protein [Mesobacillus subterraneus]|jgi:Flp pilus assembly protein TadG|uniref:TadE/TadG family type IV pilus assembly protein n=1 Tax=Mesobacillus subterraneus TaxID=285983 RepID=UPI00203C3C13|nr:TadE/TadG family type IV pilus assembly protein [Mesobacillus subterraneus]MCM3666350.1 pilus assembly protein [Mesobacillus subterraneus]MCM3685378.1 pilus assembly protein [Mesobacillus subterraneus]